MSLARVEYRCPVCRVTGPARALVVEARGVELTCDACGASTRFPPYDASLQGSIATLPDVEGGSALGKPSGNTPRRGGATDRVHNDTGFDDSTSPPRVKEDDPRIRSVVGLATVPEDLLARYRDAVREGDTLEQHEAVLKHALACSQLEAVGLIYRHRALAMPDDEVARTVRDKVIAVAMSTLAVKTDPDTARRQVSWVSSLLAALFVIGAVAFLILVISRQACPASP